MIEETCDFCGQVIRRVYRKYEDGKYRQKEDKFHCLCEDEYFQEHGH